MRYFLGLMALAGYLLLLSTFVSENVRGGVAGGNRVDTQRVGRTVVTSYEGGKQIAFGANVGFGTRLRIVAAVAFAVGLALAAFFAVRRQVAIRQLGGMAFGMVFVGVVIAFITAMPLAVVLKRVTPSVFWVVVLLVCFAGLFLFGFIGKKIYKAEI